MAINLGDAILNFRGDLTQLNLAFDEAAQSAEKLAPAQAQVDALGASFDRAATDAEAAAAAMQGAGQVGAEAGAQINAAWLKVSVATAENYKAQRELSMALRDVKATGGDGATALQRYAVAAEQASVASQNLRTAQQEAATGATQLATSEKVAGDAALVMGTEMEAAGTEAAFSMREAKASMALAGEEMGIKIPRHVRGFIAELPGVGAAMNAAFSGIALLIVIQLIVEATQKLTEFISTTFIYTEAIKEAEKAQLALNKAISDQKSELDKLKKAYELIGESGPNRTKIEFMQLTEEVTKTETALRNAKDTVYLFNAGLHDISAGEAAAAQGVIDKTIGMNGTLAVLQQKQANLSKQFDQETLSAHLEAAQSGLDADKKVADARLNLQTASLRLQVVERRISGTEEIAAINELNEQQYQSEVRFLEQKKLLAAQDPTKSVEKVRAINAEILALELKHQADIVAANARTVAILKSQRAATQESPLANKIDLSPELQALNALSEALKSIGIQGSATWAEQKQKALDAMKAIEKAGGSEIDVLRAQIEAQKADVELSKSMGLPWKGLQKDLDDTTKKYDLLTGAVLKMGRGHNTVEHQLDQFAKKLQQERGELSKNEQQFDSVLMSATGAMGNAVSQWVMGQASLGQALRQGLAEEAATIAGKAAMWALYYAAWGIADTFWNPPRAAADWAAAAEFAAVAGLAGAFAYAIKPDSNNGSSSDTSTGDTSYQQTQQPEAQPVTQTNVQHFAEGGLISRRTLAVMGDSISGGNAAEAAIPLDNPRAVAKIVEALGGGGGTTHIWQVKGMISSDTMRKTIRQINKEVENSNVKLVSTTSRRVVRK